MPTIVRHKDYACLDGEKIRLKKWSAVKLFSIVADFGSVLEDALDGINTTTINEVQLISRLIVSISRSEKRLFRIIKDSIDDPAIDDAKVRDLDPEDMLGVLADIIEMNLTEGLSKNFQRLLGATPFGATKTSGT
jgi:hypothetical protein